MTAPRIVVIGPAEDGRLPTLRSVADGVRVVSDEEPLDLAGVACLVLLVREVRAAQTRTRLIRAERGERPLAIVWWLSASAASDAEDVGLDAGADLCLRDPVAESRLGAQLRALLRSQAQAARWVTRTDELRGLNDQVREQFQREQADRHLLRGIQQAGTRRPAAIPGWRFSVADSTASGWYTLRRLEADRVEVWLADPGGDSMTASLLGLLLRQEILGREITDEGPRYLRPIEVLDRVNRSLLSLALDPPPLVGLIYAQVTSAGQVTVARAGLPAPVYVPRQRRAEVWTEPGPYLGAFDAHFGERSQVLLPGEGLILASAGRAEQIAALSDQSPGRLASEIAGAWPADQGPSPLLLSLERVGT